MSKPAQRRRFLLLAALLLAGARELQAEEEQIYKWMDEKGQIHFTATPPPRNARPIGSKPEAKPPVQIVPIPGPSRPPSPRPSAARPREIPRSVAYPRSAAAPAPERAADCGLYADQVQRVRKAQSRIEALQSSIERLENDTVSSSRTSCNSRGESLGACRDGSYNRDRELDKAREQLQAAEDELADAEHAARASSVPPECSLGD